MLVKMFPSMISKSDSHDLQTSGGLLGGSIIPFSIPIQDKLSITTSKLRKMKKGEINGEYYGICFSDVGSPRKCSKCVRIFFSSWNFASEFNEIK